MQALADVVALDLARHLDGRTAAADRHGPGLVQAQGCAESRPQPPRPSPAPVVTDDVRPRHRRRRPPASSRPGPTPTVPDAVQVTASPPSTSSSDPGSANVTSTSGGRRSIRWPASRLGSFARRVNQLQLGPAERGCWATRLTSACSATTASPPRRSRCSTSATRAGRRHDRRARWLDQHQHRPTFVLARRPRCSQPEPATPDGERSSWRRSAAHDGHHRECRFGDIIAAGHRRQIAASTPLSTCSTSSPRRCLHRQRHQRRGPPEHRLDLPG